MRIELESCVNTALYTSYGIEVKIFKYFRDNYGFHKMFFNSTIFNEFLVHLSKGTVHQFSYSPDVGLNSNLKKKNIVVAILQVVKGQSSIYQNADLL